MTPPTPPKSGRLLTIVLIAFALSAGLAVAYSQFFPNQTRAFPPSPSEAIAKAKAAELNPVVDPISSRPVSVTASDNSPGYNEMKAKMQELATAGCTNVLHPPVVVKGTVAWTPRFPDEKDSACLVLLGETGDPDKILTGMVHTPTDRKIDAPNTGADFEFVYCADAPGLYPINVTSPTNERYTFAAVDCPRDIAFKRISDASKK